MSLIIFSASQRPISLDNGLFVWDNVALMRRDAFLKVRVTKQEVERFRTQAAKTFRTLSQWVRIQLGAKP